MLLIVLGYFITYCIEKEHSLSYIKEMVIYFVSKKKRYKKNYNYGMIKFQQKA